MKKYYLIATITTIVVLASLSIVALAKSNTIKALEYQPSISSDTVQDTSNLDNLIKGKKSIAIEPREFLVVAMFPEISDRQQPQPAAPQPIDDSKYIEINVSRQTLYCWDDGKIVNSFLVSTGTYGRTPIGTFHIYSRTRAGLMSGPGYYLPNVQWISRFCGPYSIHGTYWHNNFGHPMSHGCVNASNANAAYVYSWAPMGTTVIIHY